MFSWLANTLANIQLRHHVHPMRQRGKLAVDKKGSDWCRRSSLSAERNPNFTTIKSCFKKIYTSHNVTCVTHICASLCRQVAYCTSQAFHVCANNILPFLTFVACSLATNDFHRIRDLHFLWLFLNISGHFCAPTLSASSTLSGL